MAKGKPDEAIAEYREAIRIKPSYGPFQSDLGDALLAKGDAAGAAAAFRRSLQLAPEFAPAHHHYQLGRALRAAGDRDGAIAAFREAIRLDPKTRAYQDDLEQVLKLRAERNGLVAPQP